MNEEIRRIADSTAVDRLDLVCECEHGDCFTRLALTPVEYESVPRFQTRFLTRPDHASPDERVVVETGRYVVAEKIAAATAAPPSISACAEPTEDRAPAGSASPRDRRESRHRNMNQSKHP